MSAQGHDWQEQQSNGDVPGSALMEITNAMIALYKKQFGRGPTAARTKWSGHDALTVILEETLTPAERHMVKIGEHARLRELRLIFQYASVSEFCEPVERFTGRKVRSFLSATDPEVDGLSVEVFILHPEGYTGPSRTESATH